MLQFNAFGVYILADILFLKKKVRKVFRTEGKVAAIRVYREEMLKYSDNSLVSLRKALRTVDAWCANETSPEVEDEYDL